MNKLRKCLRWLQEARQKHRRCVKWVLLGIAALLLLALLLVIVADHLVSDMRHYTFEEANLIPYNKVGVILGTSKYLVDGRRNEYFQNRIDAAVTLFNHGKISYFLVSGDNATRSYNEPREMRRELVRANAVFGQRNYTIISQQFHNERALYLARHFGIQAIGFNARDVDAYSGLKTRIRELMARVLCLLDVYILDKQPKFLGDPILIG